MTMNRVTIGLGLNNTVKDTLPKEQEDAYIAREKARKDAEAKAEAQAQADKEASDILKASAKAKLIAGEPLTEAEADTIVL